MLTCKCFSLFSLNPNKSQLLFVSSSYHSHIRNMNLKIFYRVIMRLGSNYNTYVILPVDQNVGTCLVKPGSTCAPLQPPSFVAIHLKNLQKNIAAPLRPIALQRPSQ